MQVDRSLPGQSHPWGKAQRLVGDAPGQRWAVGADPAGWAGGGGRCSQGLSLEGGTWPRVGAEAPKIQLYASHLPQLRVARIWPPNQFVVTRGFGNSDHKEGQVWLRAALRAGPQLPGAPPISAGLQGGPWQVQPLLSTSTSSQSSSACASRCCRGTKELWWPGKQHRQTQDRASTAHLSAQLCRGTQGCHRGRGGG